ncbi:MAG: tol-pal system protein YbgF, partial [Alphaproteobacteria bacterium]|nr:tol-pal system protein YbgF [Alphaproteobacteria bacterium]
MIFRLKPIFDRARDFTGWVALVCLVGLSLVLVPDVQAQSQEDLKVILDRMGRLEKDIRTMNLSLARGRPAPASTGAAPSSGAPPGTPAAVTGSGGAHALSRLSVRMSDLESDLRSVTGSMEEFNHQAASIARRLDKLVADVDYRLGLLEGRAPGAAGKPSSTPAGPPKINPAPSPPSVQKIIPGQEKSFASQPGILGTVSKSAVDALSSKAGNDKPSKPALAAAARPAASPSGRPSGRTTPTPVAAPPQPASILPKGSPKEQYNFAFGLLRQANYDNAELALQEFVKSHPKDKLASNARYWLGETYYVRAAYVQAAEVFLEGYQADPKGAKAPDSLLKLGMSLAGLDKKSDACAAFDKVVKDFPDA